MQTTGVTVTGNSMTKTGVDGWNAGGISKQMFDSGDGYVEWTATETNKYRLVGLSQWNVDEGYADPDIGVNLQANGIIGVFENTVSKGTFGAFTAGDVFRVSVESGVFKCYRNAALFYTSATQPPKYPIIVDSSMYGNGSTVTNAKIYGLISDPAHYLLAMGDSKTFQNGFQAFLALDIGYTMIDSLAANSRTTAQAKSIIDADLASHRRFAGTEAVLINFGAAEVQAMPTQANFEADMTYIADAIHVKWPTAQVYIMRPWRRGEDADSDTLATWIGNVVASRSTFVHLGPDERVFLENGDNGVTYTSDGVHPNVAGYELTATQWRTVLGY
jgi:lysophospholipase L1-like esterase